MDVQSTLSLANAYTMWGISICYTACFYQHSAITTFTHLDVVIGLRPAVIADANNTTEMADMQKHIFLDAKQSQTLESDGHTMYKHHSGWKPSS